MNIEDSRFFVNYLLYSNPESFSHIPQKKRCKKYVNDINFDPSVEI